MLYNLVYIRSGMTKMDQILRNEHLRTTLLLMAHMKSRIANINSAMVVHTHEKVSLSDTRGQLPDVYSEALASESLFNAIRVNVGTGKTNTMQDLHLPSWMSDES